MLDHLADYIYTQVIIIAIMFKNCIERYEMC